MSKDTQFWLSNIDKLKAAIEAGIIEPTTCIAELQDTIDKNAQNIIVNNQNISNTNVNILQANNNIVQMQQQLTDLELQNTNLVNTNSVFTGLISYLNGEVN